MLHERVAQLLSIDQDRAIQLLMDQYDEIPASTVVPSIQVRLTITQKKHNGGQFVNRTWDLLLPNTGITSTPVNSYHGNDHQCA